MSINKKQIHTVLEAVGIAKTKDEKVKILQDNDSSALRGILRGGFDPTLKFLLPEGIPPYDELDPDKDPIKSIESYVSQFKFFVDSEAARKLPAYKREGQYLKILRSVHPKDAKLLLDMKDCSLSGKYKGLTEALVEKAFPGLIKKK